MHKKKCHDAGAAEGLPGEGARSVTPASAAESAPGSPSGPISESPSTITPVLLENIRQHIAASGGWLPFDAFMQQALYAPGLGYYSHPRSKIGRMPADGEGAGSDFVTAPEISPLFGQCLAVQIAEVFERCGVDTVYEFGAGNGTLARDVLRHLAALGKTGVRYCIVDVSAALRERQAQTLAELDEEMGETGARVQWLDALPDTLEGVLLGNEVLDAMPVKLLVRKQGQWHERGVALDADGQLQWEDRPTALRPPLDPFAEAESGDESSAESGAESNPADEYLTEIHPWAEAFIRTTSERLRKGAALWIDYGFGEAEYYHPQRRTGTLVCHQQHRMDDAPLADVGEKDITSHVDFTAVAVAAQDAGLHVLGYTTQAHFLINCGIGAMLEQTPLAGRAMAAKLLHEHEMGELFKVIALGAGDFWEPLGFREGDRTHTL